MTTTPTLPTNGMLFSPYATLSDAVAQWSSKYASFKVVSQAREFLTKPEWFDNGYDMHGFYQRTVTVVDVEYRHTTRSQWKHDRMMFAAGEYQKAQS